VPAGVIEDGGVGLVGEHDAGRVAVQSPADARCHWTATLMGMPSMRARTVAGRSVASWNSAADRDWPQRMPIWRRRSPSWSALMGWPGRPPGNSQAEVP
jgi:hypothetical protein